MRAKSFILLLIVLAAAGAAIGAGLNYALDDAEPEPAAANNEFTFQLPSGFAPSGSWPPGAGGGVVGPDTSTAPSEPDDDGNGNDDGAQQPDRPQTPPGGLGGLGGGLLDGTVVDFDPPALVISTEAGSATLVVTEETIVSLQRPAAESGDLLTAGAKAFIVATFDNERVQDAMMIVIGDFGGSPPPPGSAFDNLSFLEGEIESVDGGVIVLKREQDTLEVRYADDVTVSAQLTVDEASGHVTPGVEVRVGAQPSGGGQLEAALIMIGGLDGFGLGGGLMPGAAGLGRGRGG